MYYYCYCLLNKIHTPLLATKKIILVICTNNLLIPNPIFWNNYDSWELNDYKTGVNIPSCVNFTNTFFLVI